MAGANQVQTITVNYVATQAIKDAAARAAAERKNLKETADFAKQKAKETSDAQIEAARKTAAAQKKEARDLLAAQKKADTERAAALKKAENDAVMAAAAGVALLTASAKRSGAAQIAVEKITAAEKRRVIKKGYDQEEEDLKNSYARRRREVTAEIQRQARDADHARAREAAATDKARKASAASLAHITAQMKDQNNVVEQGVTAAVGMAAAYVSVNAAVSGVKAFSQYFAQLRMETFEAAKEVSGFREEVLELAAMKGDLGNSTPEVIAQLNFRAQTGQSRHAALEMSQAAEGAGQAAIGKNLTRQASDEGMIALGQLQAMERSAGGAFGALYGTLQLEAKKGTTGADLKGEINRQYEIQKPGKFLNLAQFAHQREQLTSYVQTGALSGAEASGLLSALSLENSPDQAATMAQQILASTSGDFMRARGMKVLPGTEHETSAAYFQEHLGLKKTATAKETWEAAADDINKAEAAAKARGENFSADKYLQEHGLNNQEARRGYSAMAAVRKQGQWDQFQTMIDAAPDPDAIQNRFNERKGREQTIQKQLGITQGEASKILASEGTPGGGLKELQKAAFDRLQGQHKITGTFDAWKNRDAIGQFSDDLFQNKQREGWHEQVNLEAQRMLAESAKQVGVPFDIGRVGTGTGGFKDAFMGDEALYAKQQEIQKAGGDPLFDMRRDIKGATDAMNRVADAIENKMVAGKPGAAPPKPLAVKPPAPVARP